MSALDFSEYFQTEASSGTTVRVLPVISTAPQPFESVSLYRERDMLYLYICIIIYNIYLYMYNYYV